MKKILVIGGAGYIGSHMVRRLKDASYEPIVLDDLSTGYLEALPDDVGLVRGDLKNRGDVDNFFRRHSVEAVMHFAASSLVGESVKEPLKYYENNVAAMINLLGGMLAAGVTRIIFSSTAAVYGEPERVPILEEDRTAPTNPYGESKLAIERILRDLSAAGRLRYVALRYFNAAGAHHSGQTGESHSPETHLIPNVLKAAAGAAELTVFGDDYDTPDGTCIRDYVHVEDLAEAHLSALGYLDDGGKSDVFNLGNGAGYSVKEIIAAAEKVTGKRIVYRVGPRRPGDPARLVASAAKAGRVLGWKPVLGLDEIVATAWKWENRAAASKNAVLSAASL